MRCGGVYLKIQGNNNINFGWSCETHRKIMETAIKDLPQFEKYKDALEDYVQRPDHDDIGFLANKHFYFGEKIKEDTFSKEKFEEMIPGKKVLEYAKYCGEDYGTPKDYVEKKLDEGKNVILKIETEGMKNIKTLYPEAVTVFIAPPDMKTLRSRLMSRGTESEEVINKRLKRAEEEMACAPFYDYKVYNYDNRAKDAAKEIIKIVNAVKSAM